MTLTDAVEDSAGEQTARESPGRTPLPIKQLLILVVLLLAEPLTNSIIRSFNDAPTPETGNPDQNFIDLDAPEESKFYSRFLESSLFLAKAATVYQWGRLSDKLGRRPILLMGPLGLGLSTFLLGVTSNPWIQTTARSMQGISGGNMEATKAVITEITDSSNRHRAYAALPVVQSVGINIGSSIGNFLSTLNERLPVIEQFPFIRSHPLFIPCAVASMFSFFSFYVTYYGFAETLPAEFQIDWKTLWSAANNAKSFITSNVPTSTSALLHQTEDLGYGTMGETQSAADGVVADFRQEITQDVMKLLPTDKIQEGLQLRKLLGRQLVIALSNFAFISFLDQVQQILLPMMYTTPGSGPGLSAEDMTKLMGKWAGYNAPVQLFLFPWLLQRYGAKRIYTSCLTAMIVFFALFPILHFAARVLGSNSLVVKGLINAQMAISSSVYMANGCAQMFIMDAVPDTSSLGSVNGIGQSVGSSVRMMGQPFVSVFYALPLDGKIPWGYLIYALLGSVTAVGVGVASLLPQNLKE